MVDVLVLLYRIIVVDVLVLVPDHRGGCTGTVPNHCGGCTGNVPDLSG